jgi:hypothetical protein
MILGLGDITFLLKKHEILMISTILEGSGWNHQRWAASQNNCARGRNSTAVRPGSDRSTPCLEAVGFWRRHVPM